MTGADRARLAETGAHNGRAAMASVAVAVLLLGLKAHATLQTGSIAMLGSLADTGLDLIASLVTLAGVRYAAQPADREHRFGHGKAEALAALFQVSLISVAALSIILRSLSRLGGGPAPVEAEQGIVVSLIAIAATLLLLSYQRRVLRRTGSIAIRADNVHYQSDLLLNAAVIAALALEGLFGLVGADAIFGIGIGLWLGWGGWRAATHAIDQLMDREWPLDKRRRFLEVAGRHPELQGIHDLRTRTSGAQDFVQFHIWVDPEMTVAAAHQVMDEIEAKLLADFPGIDILIHADPSGHFDRGGSLAAVDAARLIDEEARIAQP